MEHVHHPAVLAFIVSHRWVFSLSYHLASFHTYWHLFPPLGTVSHRLVSLILNFLQSYSFFVTSNHFPVKGTRIPELFHPSRFILYPLPSSCDSIDAHTAIYNHEYVT